MSFRLALEDEVDHSKEGAKYRIPDYGESPPLPPIPGSPAETPSPPKASPKSRLGRKSPNRSPNRSPKRSPNRSPPRASPPRPTSRGGRAASSSQPSADDIFASALMLAEEADEEMRGLEATAKEAVSFSLAPKKSLSIVMQKKNKEAAARMAAASTNQAAEGIKGRGSQPLIGDIAPGTPWAQVAISGLVTNNRGYLTHAFTFMGGDIHTVVTADRGQSGKTGSTRVKAKAKAKRATGDDDEEEAEEREPKGARPGATSGDAHGAERPKMTFAQFASEMQTIIMVDFCWCCGCANEMSGEATFYMGQSVGANVDLALEDTILDIALRNSTIVKESTVELLRSLGATSAKFEEDEERARLEAEAKAQLEEERFQQALAEAKLTAATNATKRPSFSIAMGGHAFTEGIKRFMTADDTSSAVTTQPSARPRRTTTSGNVAAVAGKEVMGVDVSGLTKGILDAHEAAEEKRSSGAGTGTGAGAGVEAAQKGKRETMTTQQEDVLLERVESAARNIYESEEFKAMSHEEQGVFLSMVAANNDLPAEKREAAAIARGWLARDRPPASPRAAARAGKAFSDEEEASALAYFQELEVAGEYLDVAAATEKWEAEQQYKALLEMRKSGSGESQGRSSSGSRPRAGSRSGSRPTSARNSPNPSPQPSPSASPVKPLNKAYVSGGGHDQAAAKERLKALKALKAQQQTSPLDKILR